MLGRGGQGRSGPRTTFLNFFIFAPFPYFIRTHLVEFCIITESNHDASGFLDDKGLRN